MVEQDLSQRYPKQPERQLLCQAVQGLAKEIQHLLVGILQLTDQVLAMQQGTLSQ
jgi:hypothetical protein